MKTFHGLSIRHFPPPLLPVTTNFHPHCSFFVLFLWLKGWSRYFWCVILLNDIMDLHMLNLGTLVSEGPCSKASSLLWSDTYACYVGTLILYHTHIQRHTTHTEANSIAHPYNHINVHLTPPTIWLQQLPVLHRMSNSLISKTYFRNVFSFQKLLNCRSHISAD